MTDCVCCICGPHITHHFIILFEIAIRRNYVIQTNQHSGSCAKESLQVRYGIGQQRCYTMFTRPFFFPSQCKRRKRSGYARLVRAPRSAVFSGESLQGEQCSVLAWCVKQRARRIGLFHFVSFPVSIPVFITCQPPPAAGALDTPYFKGAAPFLCFGIDLRLLLVLYGFTIRTSYVNTNLRLLLVLYGFTSWIASGFVQFL